MAIRQTGLKPLASSATYHVRMVNGRAAASGDKKFDLSERIARFGDILNIHGSLAEIGPRSVFGNPGGRCQAVASGGGSAHDLNPLAWRRGVWGVGRENSGEMDVGGQPGFPGARRWVAASALSADLWAKSG